MRTIPTRMFRSRLPFGLLWAVAISLNAAAVPVRIEVDATDAPRKILHARLTIPAPPGKLVLHYPKWLPGEHGPNGPITDLVGLQVKAAGQPIPWQRDAEDMYAFQVEVPAGAEAINVALDYLLPPNAEGFSSAASSTAQLLVLSWHQVVLYPRGPRMDNIQYAATLRLPEGWRFATALPVAAQSSERIEFSPVSLEALIDSPVLAGAHVRTFDLTPGATPAHQLHVAADSAAALELKPELARQFSHLVAEARALFGSHHYRQYHFLLTLSEHVAHFGLEHHESSDNRRPERYLVDDEVRLPMAVLLPHEMVHSWNGKYRRPTAMVAPDFHQPMRTELLWVYEGLTDYLGVVLTARCGLWTQENFREDLALTAALLEAQAGRSWRSLADTAVAAQILFPARDEGTAWRRSVDFYAEGDLIWLEADVLIRRLSQGQRSLDDFCRRFCGGESGPPRVVSYTLEDVLSALNETAAHDWRGFFQQRIYTPNPRAPLGGIEGAGWRLVYKDTRPNLLKSQETAKKYTDLTFSLGLTIREDGRIIDVIPRSPADRAGIGPAMKLVAVNGRRWSPEFLRSALKAGTTNLAPIELLVENHDFFKTCAVDYHQGEKYPQLERDTDQPDLLADILKPLTPAPQR
jgi:predicted metalloprotease with PDZ domain